MSDYIVQHQTVADFEGTEFAGQFAAFDPHHPVVQAWDPETGLVCALAALPDQLPEHTAIEAQVQLAHHIRRHR